MNRLAHETSPYLRQHQHNPVDWYPWGDEALQKAKREQKPIFLSVGYSACHWCHVMEEESFADAETAKLMNEHFVCIKVDREERPDVDEIYMTAVQRMTGHGGWPMSVFLTPQGQPFYAGTYFPPQDRHGMPGFPRVLKHLAELWQNRRDEVLKAGREMQADLQKVLAPAVTAGEPTLAMVETAVKSSATRFDAEHGGFAWAPRYAPKFPHASELAMLLREHARTSDAQALAIVRKTLAEMATGGIYDQLGGGFHRYSVDREWVVPHFEKMLYDNAQLARVYAEAWLVTQDPLHRRIATETLDYLLREMQDPAGGIWSTTDADSEGEEGKFFVWTRGEIEELLGDDAELACAHWGVSDAGNFEGNNVLTLAQTAEELAAAAGLDVATVRARLAAARSKLLARRAERVAPGTDDKILASWNGLALSAFAVGHQVFGDERYLAAARRIAAFLLEQMVVDGRLRRSWRAGDARFDAYLEDYACVADGLLSLFESDFDPRWLAAALQLLGDVRERFGADDGGLWFTAADHEDLVARSRSITESSMPSGAAVAATAFLRAGLLTGDGALYDRGVAVLRSSHELLTKMPIACPSMLLALQLHLGEPREVVIAGEVDEPEVQAFLSRLRAAFPPHHVTALVTRAHAARLVELAPALAGKERIDGEPAAYVCRRGVCEAPVTSAARLVLR